jgi:hypothetical protein
MKKIFTALILTAVFTLIAIATKTIAGCDSTGKAAEPL